MTTAPTHLVTVFATCLAIAVLGCEAGSAPAGSAPGSASGPTEDAPDESASNPAFSAWLEREVRYSLGKDAELYYAYYDADADQPWFVSLMVSADVLRFLLAEGQLDAAIRVGNAFLELQHDGAGDVGDRLQGAFPSAIEEDGEGYVIAPIYDSADNLAVIEALLDLYDATEFEPYREAAVASASWIRDVMCHGERWALWTESYGVPMQSVNVDGAFDNRIAVGRTLFWLPTLRRLTALTGDRRFAEIADNSLQFLGRGQRASGGFANHYRPGWPAKPYDVTRFEAVGPDGAVYADDSIRAAIGLASEGKRGLARRFARSLESDGPVWGYIDIESGAGLFTAQDKPYYDVISSALYRDLAADMDMDTSAEARFLASVQSDNGGWYWGRFADGEPVNSDQATITGLWAVMDLRPRGPETW